MQAHRWFLIAPCIGLLLGCGSDTSNPTDGDAGVDADSIRDADGAVDSAVDDDADIDADVELDADPLPPDSHAMVGSYFVASSEIGLEMLRNGANAADVFVAVTMADYVQAPGYTSMAGPLDALVYDAESGEVQHLESGYNDVLNPFGIPPVGSPFIGMGVLVPGAIAGLESLSERYGSIPFAEAIRPALELARDGFPIDISYEWLITYRADILQRSAYGASTFFTEDGEPLRAGDVLVQPELAHFMEQLGELGSDYMYRGAWAEACVEAVQDEGGRLALEDLSRFEVNWLQPRSVEFRGYDVYTQSGRTYGGLWSNLGLAVLENATLDGEDHYTESADDLELLLRVAAVLDQQAWFYDAGVLDSDDAVAERCAPERVTELWESVMGAMSGDGGAPLPRRFHSSHVVVVDAYGNAVTGTHTINDMPWGGGIFVEGIPLNTSGLLGPYNSVGPGERRLMPFTSHIVLDEGQLFAALGAFNSSLIPGEFQFLVNLLEYNLAPADVVSMPRFGGTAWNIETEERYDGQVWLDPRVSENVVAELGRRGLRFVQTQVDTGLGVVIAYTDDGMLEGGIAPNPIDPYTPIGAALGF